MKAYHPKFLRQSQSGGFWSSEKITPSREYPLESIQRNFHWSSLSCSFYPLQSQLGLILGEEPSTSLVRRIRQEQESPKSYRHGHATANDIKPSPSRKTEVPVEGCVDCRLLVCTLVSLKPVNFQYPFKRTRYPPNAVPKGEVMWKMATRFASSVLVYLSTSISIKSIRPRTWFGRTKSQAQTICKERMSSQRTQPEI